MCGIVGIISKKTKIDFSVKILREMCAIQRHRGPDDLGMAGINLATNKGYNIEGLHKFEGKSVIGFNRLSIQDLSEKGHQPMMTKNQEVILAFNGEIYNFKELRKELIEKGYQFRSRTDTEVILNLYLEYGIEKAIRKLNGMFAIVLYDMRVKKLFLVRDRFGIKPLYFCDLEHYFLISSEIKSFLPFEEFQCELNENTLAEYMLFRNVTEETLFQRVKQVLPGEKYEINLEDNSYLKKKYFDINEYQREILGGNYREMIMETLKAVIGRQVLSDVKVGTQLSGGIDSSLISYIAAKNYGIRDTISIVVDDLRFSEEEYIDFVNERMKTDAHKKILGAEYYTENFKKTIWHFEGITVHPSTMGVYAIGETARGNVVVLLSGEGADEVFGGYNAFLKLIDVKDDVHREAVIAANGMIDEELVRDVLPEIDVKREKAKREALYDRLTGSLLDRQIKYEMASYLPELLVRQDKMCMAHSIENRVPMLDNNLVEAAFRLPEELLIDREGRQGKNILKQLCVTTFGQEFAYRKKRGFGMPTNRFLWTGRELVERTMKGIKERKIINYRWMEGAAGRISQLRGLEAELFFKVFSFEVWCRIFLDGEWKKNYR